MRVKVFRAGAHAGKSGSEQSVLLFQAAGAAGHKRYSNFRDSFLRPVFNSLDSR